MESEDLEILFERIKSLSLIALRTERPNNSLIIVDKKGKIEYLDLEEREPNKVKKVLANKELLGYILILDGISVNLDNGNKFDALSITLYSRDNYKKIVYEYDEDGKVINSRAFHKREGIDVYDYYR